MVNLKDYELKELAQRKPDKTIPKEDHIFIKLNCSKKNLPPFLKWRVEQCYKLNKNFLEQDEKNYNLYFDVVDYQEFTGIFPHSVTLRLVMMFLLGSKNFEYVVPVTEIKGESFTFQVQLKDLDKYFKRFYPLGNPNIITTKTITKDGVEVIIKENSFKKTVSVTNMNKLLIDCPIEPLITASVRCCDEDTYCYETGKELAIDKWAEKWRNWFNSYIKNRVKTEIKNREEEDKKKMKELTLTNMNGVSTTVNVKPFDKKVTLTVDTSFVADIPTKEIIGTQIGDYVVREVVRDMNKHVFWKLVCPDCSHTIYTTRTKLKNNKVNVICPDCYTYGNGDIGYGTADFVSDPSNKVTSNVSVEGTKVVEPIKTSCTNNDGYVLFSEIYGDLFNAPVWSYIAHCINADGAFAGPVAEIINENWNMKKKLENNFDELYPQQVYMMDNVFNMVVAENRYAPVTIKKLQETLEELAEYCYALEIQLVSMPKICCGKNKLRWEEVKTAIIDTFNKVYKYKNHRYEDNRQINIDIYLGE